MTEFHGPWRVKVLDVKPNPPQRLHIKGSTNADGDYALHAGQPLELRIDGAQWEILIQTYWYPSAVVTDRPVPDSWENSDGIKRSMKVLRPGPGLTVTLDSHRHQFGYDTGVTLQCVCDDPKINPPGSPNPYDFGYKPR